MITTSKTHKFLLIVVVYFTVNYVSAHEEEGANGKKEIKYTELTSEEAKKIQEACKGSMPAAEVRVNPSEIAVPNNFKKYANKIRDLKVRENDIWIISYPKSGSTWTQEMVWLLTNDVDIQTANSKYLWERVLFLEYKGLCSPENTEPDPLELIQQTPENERRYIKTHMPVELLPKEIWEKKPKIIHVSRNPYDVAVSYYYHYIIWNNYSGTKDLFFKAFLQDEVVLSPFWKHVLDYWKMRLKYEKIHFIKYEDMKKDLVTVMKGVSKFLNVQYPEEKEKELLEHLSFESMKKNKMDNFEDDIKELHKEDFEKYHYMRKGMVGSWKEEEGFESFTKKFDEWVEKNMKELKPDGFCPSPLV